MDNVKNTIPPIRGRPAQDRSALLGKVFPGTHLRIDDLTGRNNLGKPMALTTCTSVDKATGVECGKVTLKRLDKILAGRTVSCDCVRRELYMGWRHKNASKVTPERRSQLWDASQNMTKRALLAAFPSFHPATLTIVILEEHERITKALADSGNAIWQRYQVLRCCATVGIEFGLSAEAIRWIVGAVEKIHSRPSVVNRTHPGIETVTAASVEAPTMTKEEEIYANYLCGLRILRATVEDIGWGLGKRQRAVFNKDELTFMKEGGMSGKIMPLFWWAENQTRMDYETLGLRAWLNKNIEDTRIHRAALRKAFAVQRSAQTKSSLALVA